MHKNLQAPLSHLASTSVSGKAEFLLEFMSRNATVIKNKIDTPIFQYYCCTSDNKHKVMIQLDNTSA